ncbi:Plasmodium vivax Vir protein, putative [Plasmodium vivax]|nr:Plasmodium vivax Vir protein, putative [Plasmodium vivax]
MTSHDAITKIITYGFLLSDELISEKFYKYLNGLPILKEFNEYCAPLLNLGKSGRYVKNICSRMLYYLKTKDSIKDNEKYAYDACTLFNYWIYSSLDMAYRFKKDSKLYIPFTLLQGIWNDFIENKLDETNPNICKPIASIAAQEDWGKRRELLDYCTNVSDLLKITNIYTASCNKYYQHIESKTELYKEYERVCAPDSIYSCPEFFKTCKDYDPVKVLPRLPCHQEMEKMKAAASVNAMTKDREDPASPDSEAVSSDGSQLQRENAHTVTKAGNVLLGVVITSMTSGALYRFTPLGGMIRNGLGWNTNNMSNINGGDIRLYDYASEPFNPYPGEEHYIGYHPA